MYIMPIQITQQSRKYLQSMNLNSDISFILNGNGRQVEIRGLFCHVDLYVIQPTPYPHLRAVGSSGEGSSTTPNCEQVTLVAPMPPAEDSKVTDALFRTTFAHALQIKGLDGDEVIFYVFAVRLFLRPSE